LKKRVAAGERKLRMPRRASTQLRRCGSAEEGGKYAEHASKGEKELAANAWRMRATLRSGAVSHMAARGGGGIVTNVIKRKA